MRFNKLKVFVVMVLIPIALAIFFPVFAAGGESLTFEVPEAVEEFKENTNFSERLKLYAKRLEIAKIHSNICMGSEGASFVRFIWPLQKDMGAASLRYCDLLSREVKEIPSGLASIINGVTPEKIAKQMDNYFSRVPVNNEMISVYSNVEKSVVRQAEISKLSPGDIYKDKDFICADVVSESDSTGVLTRPRTTEDLYSRKKYAPEESSAIVCKINIPKGALLAGMDVIGSHGALGKGVVVLPRNTTFKVRSIKEVTKNLLDAFYDNIPEKTTKIKIVEFDVIAQERPDFIEPKQKVSCETAQGAQRDAWKHLCAHLQSGGGQTGESGPKSSFSTSYECDPKIPFARYYKYLAKTHAILATPEERYNFGMYTSIYGGFNTETMNKFFEKISETAENSTVYRAIGEKEFNDILNSKPGELYRDKSGRDFLSTSIDPYFAYSYSKRADINTPCPSGNVKNKHT